MAFREDTVPECRSSAHPAHTDRRRWMYVVKQDADFVVWCCQRCTEITGVYAIQVQILPRGRERGRRALGTEEAQKRQLLGSCSRPRQLSTAHLHTRREEPE